MVKLATKSTLTNIKNGVLTLWKCRIKKMLLKTVQHPEITASGLGLGVLATNADIKLCIYALNRYKYQEALFVFHSKHEFQEWSKRKFKVDI